MKNTPTTKKNNKKMLYAGIGLVAVAGIAALAGSGSGKPVQQIGGETFAPNPSTPSTGNSTPTPIGGTPLNKDKVLKVGSTGAEVRELQRLLKIGIDGVFGAKETEPALVKLKGVKQISLNGFAKAPNVNPNPLKAGDRLMGNNKNGAKLGIAIQKADASYYTNWETFRTIDYGQEIGILRGFDASKSNYSVYFKGTSIVAFVKAADVKKY